MGASITPIAVQATAVCLTRSHFGDVGETNNSCQFPQTLLKHTHGFHIPQHRNPNCNLKSAACKQPPPHPHPRTALQDACEFLMMVTCSQTAGNATCHSSINVSKLIGVSSRAIGNICAQSDKRSCRPRVEKSVRGCSGKSAGACTG